MKATQLFIVFIACIFLWACPYSSPYQLDDTPQQNIDESILGKWATEITHHIDDQNSEEIPVKIIFTKKSEFEYNIAVTGYLDKIRPFVFIDDDTLKGSAFVSNVLNKQVLNVAIDGKTYLAELVKKENKISIYPLSEHFTNHMARSNAATRVLLENHYRKRLTPSYDDNFSIIDLQRVN